MDTRAELKKVLGIQGRFLPMETRLWLASRLSGFRHLLSQEEPFCFKKYLGNLSIHIDPKSAIELECATGTYEPQLLNTLKQLIVPGDTCIDVGANIGAISLAMAKFVGPEGRVYCIEPGPPFFKRLERNFLANPSLLQRVRLFQVGLSEKKQTLRWSQDPEHPCNGGFIPHEDNVEIPVETLDSFVARLGIDKLDWLKIDTEGMELPVLRGATHTLSNFRPKILIETLMEFDGPKRIRQKLEAFLNQKDYELVTADLERRKISYPNFPANALALPRT